jgi:hypothetical protein
MKSEAGLAVLKSRRQITRLPASTRMGGPEVHREGNILWVLA